MPQRAPTLGASLSAFAMVAYATAIASGSTPTMTMAAVGSVAAGTLLSMKSLLP